MTPEELYALAKEMYFRVFDFEKGTKKADKQYIRVGIINNPNEVIRWNFFDGKKLLSDTNFDKADVFVNGWAVVTLNRKQNILRIDGTYLFNEWHDQIKRLDDMPDYLIVEDYLDEFGCQSRQAIFKGSEQDSEWYERIFPVAGVSGHCIVTRQTGDKLTDRKDALYDIKYRKFLSEWYDSILPWFDIVKDISVSRVRNDHKHNLMRPDGTLVFDLWSTKQINCDSHGNCQLFDSEGVHNLNVCL